MSVTTTEQGNELKADPAGSSSTNSSQEQGAATAQNTTSSANDAAGQAEAGAFDAESLEMSFGLPPGSLKDVTDEASAVAAIKEMTDKTLQAGLQQPFSPAAVTPTAEAIGAETGAESATDLLKRLADLETKVVEKKTAAEAKQIDSELLKRLAALEARDAKREKEITQQRMAEVEKRLLAEVDSWASPKYGVSGSRNYNQAKALNELRDELIPNYLGGVQASGLAVPTIEIVARRVRVFSDDTFTPAAKKAVEGVLGTPGQRKDGSNDPKAPRNIHAAYQQNVT